MGKVILNDTTLTNIANAIRNKNGETNTYLPSEMPQKILDIQSGGGGYNVEFAYANGDSTSVNKFNTEFDENVTYNLKNFLSNYKYYSEPVTNGKKIKISNANSMFYGGSKGMAVTYNFDVSGFDMSKCFDISHMFRECSAISNIVGYENWDTKNIRELTYLFYGCSSIKELDLSNWNLDNLITISGSNFDYCSSLTKLILPDLPKLSSTSIFSGYASRIPAISDFRFKDGCTFCRDMKSDVSLNLTCIWQGKTDTIKSKYENFANSIGENTTAYTRTIKLYTTLYNSLTDEQKAILTDKGYTITYGTS